VADMSNALASVISAVAEERPLVIAVDDAQWADGVSLAALGAALRLVKDSPVVLLLTVAEGVGDAPRELLQLESDVGRALSGAVLRLGLLDENDLATLVAALAPWCHNHAERDRLTRRLAYETAGNPFFAVTLLNALASASNLQKDMVAWPPRGGTIDAPLPFSVPSLVRHATVVRLGELKPPEVAVLSAASICGQALELDLIAQIAELSSDEVEAALQGCERRQLVLFDGRRYTFAAPLIAEVVRAECLTRGQRRKLERRAIDALAGRTDLQSRVLRIDLLSRVAPDQSALDLALAVARDASEMGARRMVEWSLAAAERISQDAQLDPKDVKRLRTHLL
jgi:predicted ATPase